MKNMRKIILLLFVLIYSYSYSQNNFLESRLYDKKYTIKDSLEMYDWKIYEKRMLDGNVYRYEWWQEIKWVSKNSKNIPYYKWEDGKWVIKQGDGKFYYYKWKMIKRYFVVENDEKRYIKFGEN